MRYAIVILVVAGGATGMLAWGRHTELRSRSYIATQIRYQPVALLIGIASVLLSGLLFGDHVNFLRWGDLAAPASGMGWLGVGEGDPWSRVGLTFLVIMTAVTAVVAYLQVGRTVRPRMLARALPLAVVFAIVNSLAEELLFRVTVTQTLAPVASQAFIALLAAVVFAIPHWMGIPGRAPGVLLAGFMGYFLALSILQTGGIAWAWGIHAMADVVIMGLLIAREPRQATADH